MKTNRHENGVIVVGVDSSEGAKAALRFALDEAKLRQARLRVVHTWQYGYIGVRGIEGLSPVAGADLGDLRRTAEVALDRTLNEVAPSPEADGVAVERRVSEGAPATVLVDESRSADLLVVGSRGHGGFAGLLLGSVSQQCAQHAACPVVIVRAKNGEGDEANS
jgi:nucleotide-binding universal stress UspA family protein